ncbi:HlyD family efflux transporter periplasmic adaptor subunit [Azoarcus sp. DN11]|uniref:HlyD family secretion protein n=1 Tax=Azoarcus sp. DN11 TaxID=356837 RepID=UPI000EAD5E49|nr:HlyD family efflux transporter periplasmic adaptor subunit [Azoarcus sp. DN11]AYH42918.1 EmrA/EmrK family multidrug efflux transporter periplasmic adaptor subunit [Azoarcus sp. DN11]
MSAALPASVTEAIPDRRHARRKPLLLALAGAVGVIALASGAWWSLYGARFVSTDNAYTAVEIAQVTPAVAGTVREVRVIDTQAVKAGDVLAVIDDTDARLALAEAEAELARAIRQVRGYVANDDGLGAQVRAREAETQAALARVTAAEADFERARVDLARREALADSGAVSGDDLTRAQNAFAGARANLLAARSAVDSARANHHSAKGVRQANAVLIDGTTPGDHPEVALARARRDRARIDLERTVIRAPVGGVVARRQVQVGQRVDAGAPLLAVVPLDEIHVDANFKEVQLDKVRVGQPVEVKADRYGSDASYHGFVEGFSGGTGAAFAVIPAQNATGNWIKVVQRLPVRIRLDPQELADRPLNVGLSMSVRIDTAAAGSAP